MRSFIAVELSAGILDNVARVQSELPDTGLKLVEKENLHITVKFLGDIDEETKVKVIEAMEKCKTKPFIVKCSSLGVFPSLRFMRVIWAGIESNELKQLGNSLNAELNKLGFPKEPFTPHLTIARVKGKANVQQLLIKHEETFFGECEIKKIKLKKSTLTPKGPIYETIHELELE